MQDKIITIIADLLDKDPQSINDDTLIIEDLGANSLDIIEILTDIEDTFNILVPDEVIPEFRTVGDIANYLESTQN